MVKHYFKKEKETLYPDKKTIDFILKYSQDYSKRTIKTQLVH